MFRFLKRTFAVLAFCFVGLVILGAIREGSTSTSANDPAAPPDQQQSQTPPDSTGANAVEPTKQGNSDTIQYDPDAAARTEKLNRIEAQSADCFDQATHMALMQGMRSKSAILQYTKALCGPGLKQLLTAVGGQTVPDADATAQSMAERALDDNLH